MTHFKDLKYLRSVLIRNEDTSLAYIRLFLGSSEETPDLVIDLPPHLAIVVFDVLGFAVDQVLLMELASGRGGPVPSLALEDGSFVEVPAVSVLFNHLHPVTDSVH